MDTALGLLGIAVWMVAVVAIAAAVTYLVVRIFPGEKPASSSPHPPA
ncbi:MAG: hypothetical protein M3188_00905 [Actinomycetota bacterium]|jgi:hypothetical protein|nr:hypothetical protein [Actinomycetota bacterium]